MKTTEEYFKNKISRIIYEKHGYEIVIRRDDLIEIIDEIKINVFNDLNSILKETLRDKEVLKNSAIINKNIELYRNYFIECALMFELINKFDIYKKII